MTRYNFLKEPLLLYPASVLSSQLDQEKRCFYSIFFQKLRKKNTQIIVQFFKNLHFA